MLVKKYQHISFDLDGTLVGTLSEYRYRVVSQVIEQLGGSSVDLRLIDKFWFEHGRDQIIQQDFKLEPQSFWPLFRQLDSIEDRAQYTSPYQDTHGVLKRIKELGKMVTIITGSPPWIAQMEISKLDNSHLDYWLSIGESRLPEKPDPQSFHLVLKKINSLAQDTLYVGNSNEDALFAKNCGVDFVYLERNEYQSNPRNVISQIIYSLEELF